MLRERDQLVVRVNWSYSDVDGVRILGNDRNENAVNMNTFVGVYGHVRLALDVEQRQRILISTGCTAARSQKARSTLLNSPEL